MSLSLFVLDASGDKNLLDKDAHVVHKLVNKKRRRLLDEKVETKVIASTAIEYSDNEDGADDGDFFGLPPPNIDLSKIINEALVITELPKSKVQQELQHAKEQVEATMERAQAHPYSRRGRVVDLDYCGFNPITGTHDDEHLVRTDVVKEMAKTEMVAGLEKLKELPSITKKKQRKLNRIERAKTKGAKWYNMPATEMTKEIRNDLKLIQMRSVLDPKHFYKKNDLKVLPKYFQIGTVQHSPLDHYSERDTRRNKKKSIVEELLADAEAQKFTKRKYKEVMAARKDKYAQRKAVQKMKKLKKKK